MSQRNRDRFIVAMTAEGVTTKAARLLMRHSATLHRIAELSCSSEAADRDRVKCKGFTRFGTCLCSDYGAFDAATGQHGTVPRINVQEAHVQARIEAICAPFGIKPIFQGDPRGAVLKLQVPSGKTDDWGQTGICVP